MECSCVVIEVGLFSLLFFFVLFFVYVGGGGCSWDVTLCDAYMNHWIYLINNMIVPTYLYDANWLAMGSLNTKFRLILKCLVSKFALPRSFSSSFPILETLLSTMKTDGYFCRYLF